MYAIYIPGSDFFLSDAPFFEHRTAGVRSKFNTHAQKDGAGHVGLSATGGKIFHIDRSRLVWRTTKKAIRNLEEGTPFAAASGSKTGFLVFFSTIWSITDSRSRG